MADYTTHTCSKCGKIFPVEELHALPEVEAYERAYVIAASSQSPAPSIYNEEELKERYGFGGLDLFCEDCLSTLIQNRK